MNLPISLCMIVKNAEETLGRCLKSVKDLVREIVIVDTGSTDSTKEIAISYGAKVFQHPWANDFSQARNISIEMAQYVWILVLDADEWVFEYNIPLLREIITKKKPEAHTIKIRNEFLNNGEKCEFVVALPRFFPRGQYHYVNRIHEQLVPIHNSFMIQDSGIKVLHDGYLNEDRMHYEKFYRNLNLLQIEVKEKGESLYLSYQIGKSYFIHKDYELAKQAFETALKYADPSDRITHSLVIDYGYTLKKLKLTEVAISFVESWLTAYDDSSELWFLLAGLYTQRGKQTDIDTVISCYKTCLKLGDSVKYDSVLGTGSYLAAQNLGLLLQLLGNEKLAQEFFLHSKNMKLSMAIIE